MKRFYERVLERWAVLSGRWRWFAVGAFVLVVGAASLAGYHQWEYMQHDNRFCTSCHLMVDPFQRFARSAHAKLECHTCHEGHLPEQLHQIWLTLVVHPTTIGRHASVPNSVCAKCHITGDSTRWKIIAATAGHRIHLESKDPRLRGMKCVTCHGVSLHQFASVDQTCAQTGCHDHNRIRLGKMGQMSELHCTTCHNFLAQARTFAVDSLGKPLTPGAAQCLTCHEMQKQMQGMDIDKDPHGGLCGDCHNPHVQSGVPTDSTCTSAGCHRGWQRLSFHIGVPHPDRCTTCHKPHSWTVDGRQCLRCHADIPRQTPSRLRGAFLRNRTVSLGGRVGAGPRTRLTVPTAVADFASRGEGDAGAALLQQPRPRQAPGPLGFSHGDHRGQACSACHSSRIRHGELLIKSVTDCQRCHHSGPARLVCSTCHDVTALEGRVLQTPQTFQLAAGHATISRAFPFPHGKHASIACVQCHTDPVTRAPAGANCASCHASHHQDGVTCSTCHAAANPIALHKSADHPNCASAACHGARAANLPHTRAMCLTCHQAQTNHVPGRTCEDCHKVMVRS